METLSEWVHRITRVGVFIGGFFLIVAMLLLMGNIFGRFVHFVIPGSYEMFELFMVVPVGFGLAYAGLHQGHVVVNLIVSRFPPRLRAAAEVLAALLSLVIWGLITWGGMRLAFENGLREISDVLGMPYLPFRIVWMIALTLFCLSYLLDLQQAVRRVVKK
jgi:TRAP-type C4-dicarboxylate transport system permease small subunit